MGIISAYNAKVRLDGATFLGAEWEVDTDPGLFDGVTFEDAGFDKSYSGIRRATATVRGFWDAATNYFDTPPSIIDGDLLVNLRLYPENALAVNWYFPIWRVAKVRMMAQVRDGVKMDFDGRNHGVYYYPGGFN